MATDDANGKGNRGYAVGRGYGAIGASRRGLTGHEARVYTGTYGQTLANRQKRRS